MSSGGCLRLPRSFSRLPCSTLFCRCLLAELGSAAALALGDAGPVPEGFSPGKKESLQDARRKIQERMNSEMGAELIDSLVDEALGVKKGVYVDFNCKGCGQAQRQLAQVADVVTQIKAAEFLLNQGDGRPGESKPAEQSVVVERRVIYAGVEGDSE